MLKLIGRALCGLVAAVIVLGGLCTPVHFAMQRDEYLRLEHTAVQLTAYVTRVKVNQNNDYRDDYTHYVSYQYMDEEYRDVRLDTRSQRRPLNTPVTIYVDPDDPAHLRPDDPGANGVLMGLLFSGPTLVALIWLGGRWLTGRAVRREQPALYISGRLTKDTILKDINLERTHAVANVKRLFGVAAAIVALVCAVHQLIRGTGAMIAALAPALVLPALFTWLYVRAVGKTVDDVQLLTSVYSQQTERDSDGDLVTREFLSGASIPPGTNLERIYVTNLQEAWTEVKERRAQFLIAITPGDQNVQRIFNPEEFSL